MQRSRSREGASYLWLGAALILLEVPLWFLAQRALGWVLAASPSHIECQGGRGIHFDHCVSVADSIWPNAVACFYLVLAGLLLAAGMAFGGRWLYRRLRSRSR